MTAVHPVCDIEVCGEEAEIAQEVLVVADRVHQFGLRDKPSIKAKAVPYPRRELLGATAADREQLLDMLYTHIAAS